MKETNQKVRIIHHSELGLTKPPIGLKPRFVAERERRIEILEAMTRYNNENKEIPIAWIEELKELRGFAYK